MNSTYSPNSASAVPGNSNPGIAMPTPPASSSLGTPSVTPAASATAKTSTGTAQKEDKADVLKGKMTDTVQQFGRSFKSLFRLPEQVRRHPLATVLGSTGVLLVLGGGITAAILESQRRQTFSYRFMKGMRNVTRLLSR